MVAALFFCEPAWPLTADELRTDAPPCKTTKAKRPKLPVNFAHDAPVEIIADFNGDGWCDYALGVGYPVNSKMNSYYLSELLLLGEQRGWRRPFNGKKPWLPPIGLLDSNVWARDRVDLTDISLLYPKAGGAPYVLGIYNGRDFSKVHVNYCDQYTSVHRWDDEVGAFKRVEGDEREVVLNYFYTAIEKPCPPCQAGSCRLPCTDAGLGFSQCMVPSGCERYDVSCDPNCRRYDNCNWTDPSRKR